MSVRPDVALIAPYPPAGQRHGGHSGVASYTANLAHALAGNGVQVAVIAAEVEGDSGEFADGPVAVRRAFQLGPWALPAAARAARDTGAPLIHLQWELFLYGGPPSIPGLFPALGTLRRGDAPLVTTVHQVVDPLEIDGRYTRLHHVGAPALVARRGLATVQGAIRRGASAAIVHEEPFRRVLPEATVIPHGIEQVPRIDRAVARDVLGLDDRFVALCFGFVAPYKGVETVLEAAELAGPSVHLVIAGGDHPRLDGDFASGLRERYDDLATFTGFVPDDAVAHWFAAADVAVFPYPKPFAASGALALALAHRTPVLLSPALARCAGAPSSLTVNLDPRAMAERLRHLAADPSALHALRRSVATLAAGRSWPAVARRHIELYEEVLDAERSPRWRLRAG